MIAMTGGPSRHTTWPWGYGSRLSARMRSLGRDDSVVVARAGSSLIRRQRNLVVDQRVQRRLDVGLAVDHAGLLQRHAGGEDRLALRRADPAVRQLGAFLELLVDHVVRQLGDGDEGLLQLVVIGERIFTR